MKKHGVLFFLVLVSLSGAAMAADPMDACRQQAATIVAGTTTREQVETQMAKDGGLMGVFAHERYYFRGSQTSTNPAMALYCKLTIDFRPSGISASAYDDPMLYSEWKREQAQSGKAIRPSPQDVVAKLSPPVLEMLNN